MELTYFSLRTDDSYEPLYTYKEGTIDPNEIYARQLCEYFVKNGLQYELISNEMEQNMEMLIVKEIGPSIRIEGERLYTNTNEGLHLEFRQYNSPSDMPLLYTLEINKYGRGHWDIIRYLLKDYIDIPGIGIRKRDSAELDEDRNCYVMYVTPEIY
ncbi:RNA helicase [Bacillus sp. 165]|uniref:RNA helicase n=1 Tax=Bacillus sp. 165 TaxID=1529117 RepID=UPI001ADBD6F2|nr:RNA helicase [Bacillus sp. 165]MBO9129858.1 RNA helicase [Bacillus sp. 165]